MAQLTKRRKELRTELLQIEKQIYDLETAYLDETKDFGNIFTGWASYLSTEKVKARKSIVNEDRLFSLSSVTSPASRREEHKKAAKSGAAVPKRPRKRREASICPPENIKETSANPMEINEVIAID